MTPPVRRSLVFAFQPSGQGFGWVAFEGPFSPFDWGFVLVEKDKNEKCLQRLDKLLMKLTPEVFVIELADHHLSTRSERVETLCQAAVQLAADRGTSVEIYTKADIRLAFGEVGARTRQQIANAVCRHVEAFRHLLPRPRRPWEKEGRRMPIFSAAALVFTHYRIGASRLFERLLDES